MQNFGKLITSALAACAAMASSALAAVTIVPSTDLETLLPGQSFTLTLQTDDTQSDFTGVQLDLSFDADVIGYVGATFNDAFPLFFNGQEEPADAAGPITIQNITGASFGTTLSGAQDVVTLEFVSRGRGTTNLGIVGTTNALLVNGFTPVSDQTFALSASVLAPSAEVPLPAAAPLMLAGLGLLQLRRKKTA